MWKVGAPRATPAGTPLKGKYSESYWCGDLCPFVDASSEALESALLRFAKNLRAHQAFLLDVRNAGGRAEFYVGVNGPGSYGFEFTPDLLAELASIGLTLSLEVFPVPQHR